MTVSCSKVLKDTHQYIFDLYLTVYYNSQRENLSNAVVNCNKYQMTLSRPSPCFNDVKADHRRVLMTLKQTIAVF
jgi:hypothetical protein